MMEWKSHKAEWNSGDCLTAQDLNDLGNNLTFLKAKLDAVATTLLFNSPTGVTSYRDETMINYDYIIVICGFAGNNINMGFLSPKTAVECTNGCCQYDNCYELNGTNPTSARYVRLFYRDNYTLILYVNNATNSNYTIKKIYGINLGAENEKQ